MSYEPNKTPLLGALLPVEIRVETG